MSENKPEPVFPNGVFFNKPHDNAPDFIKGSIDISDVGSFIEFLKQNQQRNRLTLDLKKSKAGKLYFQLNTWVPPEKEEDTEEPPF